MNYIEKNLKKIYFYDTFKLIFLKQNITQNENNIITKFLIF